MIFVTYINALQETNKWSSSKMSQKGLLILTMTNSSRIWFWQAFNNKVVIARCLVQYWQIYSSFLKFCLKARENKLQNIRNTENISQTVLGTRAITTTHWYYIENRANQLTALYSGDRGLEPISYQWFLSISPGNLWFFYVFRGYKNISVAWDGLIG